MDNTHLKPTMTKVRIKSSTLGCREIWIPLYTWEHHYVPATQKVNKFRSQYSNKPQDFRVIYIFPDLETIAKRSQKFIE
jgi:hypothetical protein